MLMLNHLQRLIVAPDGEVLARNAVSVFDAVGGGMPGEIGILAQQFFENKIGQLFYPPDIRACLADDE